MSTSLSPSAGTGPASAEAAERLLRRLRARLVAGLVLTGVVLAALVGGFFYVSRAAQLDADLYYNARLQNHVLQSQLQRMEDIAAQIASRTRIRDELARHLRGEVSLQALQTFSRAKLQEAMAAGEGVLGIVRVDRDGRPLVAVGEPVPKALWPRQRLRDRITFGTVAVTASGPRLVVAAPLCDRDDRWLGTDLVLFDASNLARAMQLFGGRYSGGITLLAGRVDGKLHWFLRQGADPAARPGLLALAEREVEEEWNVSDEKVHALKVPGLRLVGFHRKLGDSGWMFLHLVPANRFYAPARREALHAATAVLLLAIIGALFSLWLARPLARHLAAEHATLHRLLQEKRRLLERVRVNEEQFRNLVETSRDWFWEVDAAGRYTYVSPRCRDLLGYEPEELIGRTLFELMPPAEAHRVARRFARLAAQKAPVENLENLNRRRDGRPVVLETSALPYFDAHGRLAGYRGTDRDVTERRRAEIELRQSEESYRGLFDAVLDAIFIQDLEGRFIDVNPAAQTMLGRPREWFLGRRPRDFAEEARNDRAAVEHAWAAAVAGSPQRFGYWARRADGEIFPMEVVLNRGRYRGRSVVIAVARDMSEHHEKEARLARAAREWTMALNQFDQGVALLDSAGRLLRANRAFFRRLDLDPEQALERPLVETLSACPLAEALRQGKETSAVLEPDDPDNPTGRPLKASLRILRDDEGQASGLLLVLRDLTDERRIQERLRLAASVFENTDEGVVVTDAQARIVEVNPAFTEITGYRREEVIGRTPALWKSDRHDPEFYREMWQSLLQAGRWRGELWNRRRNGELFPEWLTISSITDARGRVTHYVGVFSDISQIKRSQEQLDYLAHHDPLTGLPNRLLLGERLELGIRHARRLGTQLAVLFLDLDRFKHINDSLGHPAGDRLLQEIAGKLRAAVRQDDTVARIGGDEFVLILNEIHSLDQVVRVAEKLRALWADPIDLGLREVRVTGSLGIALYPRDGQDPATLLRNADAAMYRAKEEGRDTFRFYTEELTRNAFERVMLEHSLRLALEREEFHLHYQPQVRLADGRITGFEALLRWNHPELGAMAPERFIPVAEESGLIHDIGLWVLHRACRQARRWLDEGVPFGRISVNLSGPQIQREGLVERVARVLDESGLPAGRLELEVTEGFIMQQTEPAVAQLQGLRDLGVTLAIDDFGTGHSSLAYLKKLPIDRLKIDRSFVRDIPSDANDLAIVQAIIALGRSLGLATIAEGVETPEQARVLRRAGCQEAQGYFYGRPTPAREVATRALGNARPSLN